MISYILPFKVRKWFKSGIRVYFNLTWHCNLSCSYCALFWHNGKWPKKNELSIDGWKRIIDSLVDVKEIIMTGGEPMLYYGYNEVCNYALSKGYFVITNSNLLSISGLGVKPHPRFLIYSSYHPGMTLIQSKIWHNNYRMYKQKYRVRKDILSVSKEIMTKENGKSICYDSYRIMYDPVGIPYSSFGKLMEKQDYDN